MAGDCYFFKKNNSGLCGFLNLSEMPMKTNLIIDAYKTKRACEKYWEVPVQCTPRSISVCWRVKTIAVFQVPMGSCVFTVFLYWRTLAESDEHGHIYPNCKEVNMLSFSTKQDPWATRTRWRFDLPFKQWLQSQRLPLIPEICQFQHLH